MPALRVVLIQLPLPDPDFRAAQANVRLAAGYLAAYARQALGDAVAIDILPEDLAAFGGDEAILSFVERGKYDAAGLTAYLWNLERSLALARALKARTGALIFMGGPEIAPGRRLLDRSEVDAFFTGEGEATFAEALSMILRGEELPRLMKARKSLPLRDLPNPYLAGILPVLPGSILHLETMRGCPRACRYCCYARSQPALRRFPAPVIRDFFALAAEQGAGEVYLMDPSLECRPRFDDFLSRIAAANQERIPLHAELKLEAVTDGRADLLKEAGVVSVEAGLQSTNPRALRLAGRTWNRDKFLKGAERLRARGIEIRTGVILGLPGDGLDDFNRTLEFVREHGLADHAEVYPLALLPGSGFERRAGEFGLEAMRLPPYWALKTADLAFDDWFAAEALVREKWGKSLFEPVRPHFADARGFIAFRRIETEADLAELMSRPERLANSLTLLLSDELFRDLGRLQRLAAWLRRYNPSGLLQLVVKAGRAIADDEAERVSDCFFSPEAFLERCHAFDDDPQGRFSVRLFVLCQDPKPAREFTERASFIDPILECARGTVRLAAPFLEAERPLVLVPGDLGADELDELRKIYEDTPECLLYYGNENPGRT